MAVITLTIPDDKVAQVVDAICASNRYGERVPGTPGTVGEGETKPQFAKRMVAEMVKRVVLDHIRKVEAEAAMAKVTLDSIDIS